MIPDSEIINKQLIKASAELPVTMVCKAFGIARSVFYYRKQRYLKQGLLTSRSKRPRHSRATSHETVARIAELSTMQGWRAARISRELAKQGITLSERTIRKYIPPQIAPKPRRKHLPRQYGRLEQLQLDVKGRFYVGKKKLYPIGIIDRGTRVALTKLKPSFKADHIIDVCEEFIDTYGKPVIIKTDNHHCFTSKKFNNWMNKNGIHHRYIQKRSPWQNGYIESYFKTMQTEFLQENYFTTIHQATTKMRDFVNDYNTKRYHSMTRCTPYEKFNNTDDNLMSNLSKMSLP